MHHLIDEVDLTAFNTHYRNDEAGATAHDPAMLLRAVLLGYSQGLVSSRAIERACRDNILFVAITGDAKPHLTTVAAFVSRSRDIIATVFAQVLAIRAAPTPSGATHYRSPVLLSVVLHHSW